MLINSYIIVHVIALRFPMHVKIQFVKNMRHENFIISQNIDIRVNHHRDIY